jgi:Cof subfamily protein (haloacid dehalogenase superfamily)
MLLAFDLDKTVVTSDYRLPDRVRRSIAAAREAGHAVTVLTGRSEASAREFLDLLAVSGPYSTNHGARVVGKDGELLRQSVLEAGTVQDLLRRYGHIPGLESSCSAHNKLFVRDPADERWKWAHTLEHELVALGSYRDEPADKFVFACEDGVSEMHRELLGSLPGLTYYLWEDRYLEITAADADKGSALALIAAALGYDRGETVAFGDGVNDVSMIAWAGRGVAVGFAHEDVLALADEHIREPEAYGVAEWIEGNLLEVAAGPSRG